MKVQFSSPKKQRVCYSHELLYKELVRAYLYDWYERADSLVRDAVVSEEIKVGEADLLVALAQDFVATQRMVNISLNSQNEVSIIQGSTTT